MKSLYERLRAGEFNTPKDEEITLYERLRAGEFNQPAVPETPDQTIAEPATIAPELPPIADPFSGGYMPASFAPVKADPDALKEGAKKLGNTINWLPTAGMIGATIKPDEWEAEMAKVLESEGVDPEVLNSALIKLGYPGGAVGKNVVNWLITKGLLGPVGAAADAIPAVAKMAPVAKAALGSAATGVVKRGVVDPLTTEGDKPTMRDILAEGAFWGAMGGTGTALRDVAPSIPTMIGRPAKTGLSALAGSLAASPITEEKETLGGMALNAGFMALFDAANLALNPMERAMAEGQRKNALIQKKVLKPLNEFSQKLNKELGNIAQGDPSQVVNQLTKTRDDSLNYIEHLAQKNKWSPEFEQYAKNVVNSSINGTIANYNVQQAAGPSIGQQATQTTAQVPIISKGIQAPVGKTATPPTGLSIPVQASKLGTGGVFPAGQGQTLAKVDEKLPTDEHGGQTGVQEVATEVKDQPPKPINTVLVNTLRKLAQSLDKQIEAKKNPAIANQNPTARRASIAASMYQEGERLERHQQVLNRLADLHESGDVPESLSKINARAQIEQLERLASASVWRAYQAKAAESYKDDYEDDKHGKYVQFGGHIHPDHIKDLLAKTKGKPGTAEAARIVERIVIKDGRFTSDREIKALETLSKLTAANKGVKEGLTEFKRLKKLGINDTEQLRQALKDFAELGEMKQEPDQAKKLRDMETALIGTKIPGYFPTPKPIAQDVVERADIKPGMKVLEPSAGKGNIADEVPKDADLDVIEINYTLSGILKEKGHNIVGSDFLEHKGEYDRIVMNPPFEKGQDIDHVRHAYDLLKPGGKVVAIMSEGSFFRSDKKATAFRAWFDEVGGTSEKLPEKSFTGKDADRQTGVSVRMVEIEKGGTAKAVDPSQSIQAVDIELENLKSGDRVVFTPSSKEAIKYQYRTIEGIVDTVYNDGEIINVLTVDEDGTHDVMTVNSRDYALTSYEPRKDETKPKTKTPEAKKKELPKMRYTANAADLAADYKAKGIPRQSAYSYFARDRQLKPEMDAKEFNKIYDIVSPKSFGDEIPQHAMNPAQMVGIEKGETAKTGEHKITPSGHADSGGYARREEGKSQESTFTRADTGGNADRDTLKKRETQTLELPELVELAKEINKGKYPHIKEKMGGIRGAFKSKGKHGTITLRADIFKDPIDAAKTLAHEIGHLVDWLPDKTMARGNILGRIASLKKYMKHMISEIPVKPVLLPQIPQRPSISVDSREGARKGKGTSVSTGGKLPPKGFISRQQVMDELKAVSMEWKPFDPNDDPKFTKYRFSSAELYADAISVLLNEPTLLQEKAPTFYRAFMNYLERKPVVKSTYEEIMERIKDREAVTDKRLKDIYQMFTKDAEVRNKINQERNNLEPIKDTIIRWLIDKNHAVLKISKRLQRQGGLKETLGKEVQYGLEEANYIAAEVDNYVYRIGKDVLTPMNEAKLTADDIGTYLFLKRVQTERSEIANPLGHTPETAKEVLDGLQKRMGKEKYAKLEKVVAEYRKIREEMIIPRMKEAKMYSPDLLETMEESKDYARFSVLNYLEKKYGRGETARVYKQIGTLSEISNPFVATVLQDISMIRAAKINEVKLATVDMLKTAGAIEPADMYYSLDIKGRKPKVPPRPDQDIFSVMVNGKMRHYYVHKDIAKCFETNPYEATVIAKIWGLLNQPLRDVFVSKNPLWMVRNVIRDFRTTQKNLPQIKPRDSGKLLKAYREAYKEAWAEVMKGERSEDITEMMKGYMLTSDRAYTSRESTFENEIERLVEEFQLNVGADKKSRGALAMLKRFYNYLDKLGRVSEIGGKVAGYKYLKKYTALPQRETGHVVRTRVGTPDYKRRGALHALTNNVFLFSNVNKEGARASYESFRDDKGAYIWKTIIFNILPKILLLGAAAVGPPELKKIIDGISEYDKRSYTVIPLGQDENGKSVYLRIPEDYEGQVFGAIAWDIANGKITGPGGALDVAGQMQPYQLHPLISVGADLYQYYIQGINPMDEYRGRQIIPHTEFQAGGAAASKEMLKHTWDELGGTIIYNPGGPAQYADTTFEKLLQYPPLNILGAFLKVSDYGHKEIEMEQERKAQKTKARERLIHRQMEEALKKKDMRRYYELRQKLKK